MTIETKYIAFDGTKFDNEKDCLEYEASIQEKFRCVVFLDKNRNVIVHPSVVQVEQEAYFMYIVDAKKSPELFDWISSQTGFISPSCRYNDNDVLEWDNPEEIWRNQTTEYLLLKSKVESVASRAEPFKS